MLRQLETAVAGAAFVAIGIMSLRRGIAILKGRSQPIRWATVEAVILRSRVRRDGSTFKPEVWYRYVYNGTEYESDVIDPSGFTFGDSDAFAKATVARYPPTARVTAYLDRSNPATSYLEPQFGLEGEPIMPTVLGILSTLAGLVALVGVIYEMAVGPITIDFG